MSGSPRGGKWKDEEKNSFIAKKMPNPNPIKQDIKNYHCAMLKHKMEFFKQWTSLKKSLLEHHFISFLKDLSNEDLVTLCELLTTKIANPQKKLYAIPSKWSHNMKETKFYNHLWIDKLLDYH
jgi:hypothetical protein